MNAIDVIKTELACVQRDCCRVENQCAKCDLVLPVEEEIISAYKKCISVLLEHEELENKIADIKANCDLAIEGRDVKIMELEKDYKVLQTSYNILKDNDEKIIKEMGEQIEKMKGCYNCRYGEDDSVSFPCTRCNRCIPEVIREGDTDKWELRR